MKRYENPRSGITAYRIGKDFIEVRFASGGTYAYDYDSAGKARIERMKELARAGRGLNTFISKYVKANYARKGRGPREEE